MKVEIIGSWLKLLREKRELARPVDYRTEMRSFGCFRDYSQSALWKITDEITAEKGSAILQNSEMFGAETILMDRATDQIPLSDSPYD